MCCLVDLIFVLLRQFPFDNQHCKIEMRLERGSSPVWGRRLVRDGWPSHPDPEFPHLGQTNSVNLDNKRVSEWKIFCHRYEESKTQFGGCEKWLKTTCTHIDKKDDKSEMSFEFVVNRIPHHYLRNIASVSSAISFLGLSSFVGLRVDDNADRAATNVTLLLAAISLKFAFATAIPKLPYATCLDKKLKSCMVLLMFVTIGQHATAAIKHRLGLFTDVTADYLDVAFGLAFLVRFLFIETEFWVYNAWKFYYAFEDPAKLPLEVRLSGITTIMACCVRRFKNNPALVGFLPHQPMGTLSAFRHHSINPSASLRPA
jgi:hypothetical protein